MPLRFSLREHKYYAAYNPDYTFSKQTATILRQTTPNPSLGFGWIFIAVPRAWLHGKYLRWNWQGGGSYVEAVHTVLIYDGEYVRSNDADFPDGSDIPVKGAGLLQTLASRTTTFGPLTDDVQANVAGGNQAKCTIMFRLSDGYLAQNFWQQIDWFQINTGAGGAGNLYSEEFTDSVHMERTGTTGDYGYISDGVVAAPPSVSTKAATSISGTGATLNGRIDEAEPLCDERGFDWGTSPGVYPNSWTETGSFGVGDFSHPITGLAPDTRHYFRAKAHNSEGWAYGSELSFITTAEAVFFLVAEDEPPLRPHSIYTDLVNLPDPVRLGLTIRVYNYDDVTLYMRVDAYNASWTFSTVDLGSLGSGSSAYYHLDQWGQRAKPASAVTEPITVRLRAYTDAGYTNLKWTYTRIVTVVMIKSDDGSWTQDVLNNFDDGTVQGWAAAGVSNMAGGYPTIAVVTDYVLSIPNSCKLTQRPALECTLGSSRLYKSFTTADRSQVYAIADVRCRAVKTPNPENWLAYIQAWRAGVTFLQCGYFTGTEVADRIPGDRWLRVVFPLPRNQSVEVSLVLGVRHCRSQDGIMWLDDFRIISKD